MDDEENFLLVLLTLENNTILIMNIADNVVSIEFAIETVKFDSI